MIIPTNLTALTIYNDTLNQTAPFNVSILTGKDDWETFNL